MIIDKVRYDLLTEREKIIIELAFQGLTSKQIADKLNISWKTVQSHRSNVYKKLGITVKPHAQLNDIKEAYHIAASIPINS